MSKGVPTAAFSLTVIQHPDNKRFALVHEKATRGWWLPGGGVDEGQTLEEAAIREAEEEAGCEIELTGVLRLESTAGKMMSRLRTIYHARPVNPDAPLKSVPDKESKGARWVTLEETVAIKQNKFNVEDCYLRGDEPFEWFSYLSNGGKVYPMSVLESVRNGEEVIFEGTGSPPRIAYATRNIAYVTCLSPEGKILAIKSGGKYTLPTKETTGRSSFLDGANKLAKKHNLKPPHGVGCINHRLDNSNEDKKTHFALLQVVYLSPAPETPPKGLEWIEASSLTGSRTFACLEPQLKSMKQAYPLTLVSANEYAKPVVTN